MSSCFCCRVAAAYNQPRLLATHHRPFHLNDFTLRECITAVLAFLVRTCASRLRVYKDCASIHLLVAEPRFLCLHVKCVCACPYVKEWDCAQVSALANAAGVGGGAFFVPLFKVCSAAALHGAKILGTRVQHMLIQPNAVS